MSPGESRAASFLPTIKCSICGYEVELSALVDHVCSNTVSLENKAFEGLESDLLPAPLKLSQKAPLDPLARPRPPAIDPQAANLPFFKKDAKSVAPSSNHSTESRATNASSNFLSVSNSTANTTPVSGDPLTSSVPKSPVRFLMPLMSPRNESPTDPNYVPVSPSTDNSNIFKRMDTIAPGPFSLSSSSSLRRAAAKPLPQAPNPLGGSAKLDTQEDHVSSSQDKSNEPIGLPATPNSGLASRSKTVKVSKGLPSVPGDDQEAPKPLMRRETDAAHKKALSTDRNMRDLKPLPPIKREATVRSQSPTRLEQRARTFPENDAPSFPSHSKKNSKNPLDLPLGLPRRPSEPTQALKSVPSFRSAGTSDSSSSRGGRGQPAPAPLANNGRVQNIQAMKNGKSLPQSPRPDISSSRPPVRPVDDSSRAPERSRRLEDNFGDDAMDLPAIEPDRKVNGLSKAKTWDTSPEKTQKPRKLTFKASPEQSSPTKVKAVCRECRLTIEGERPVFSSDGKLSGKFHKRCFKCAHCKVPFYPKPAQNKPLKKEQPSTFYVWDDQPLCAHDYHARNNSLCPVCGLGIEGQCREVDWNSDRPVRYHLECFSCAAPRCTEDFELGFYEIGMKKYCVRHAPSTTTSTRRFTRMMPLI